MNNDTSGVGTWKHFYREYRHAVLYFSNQAQCDLRQLMQQYRNEAALERIVARQARTIEAQAQRIEELEREVKVDNMLMSEGATLIYELRKERDKARRDLQEFLSVTLR